MLKEMLKSVIINGVIGGDVEFIASDVDVYKINLSGDTISFMPECINWIDKTSQNLKVELSQSDILDLYKMVKRLYVKNTNTL